MQRLLRVFEFVANLLPWGVPLVIGWLAWLQSVSWYIIGLSIVILSVAILHGKNQFDVFRERRRKGFTSQDNTKIEATLRSWLDKWKFKISRDPQPNMLFQFKAEDRLGCVMLVARPKDVSSFILIGGRWNIPPELEEQFNSMPDNMRMDMLENLQTEMLRLGVSYIGLDILKQVGIEVRVPCDENCTEFVFLKEFEKARYAYLLMMTIMRKSLRHAGHVSKPSIPDKEGSQKK